MSLGFAGRNKTVTLTSKPQVIADYNLHRHGLFIYNDADAPCKIAFGMEPEAGDYFTLGAGNKIELDSIVPVGPVWATGAGPLHLMDNAMGDSTVGWTPQDLLPEFTDGHALWYDASDAATLFEDTAAAVPATIGGQVGMILDKSGNGMNLTFVEGEKPTWDGQKLTFKKDAKFVLPGFLDPTWMHTQPTGSTYYSAALAPEKPSSYSGRPTLFQFAGEVSARMGSALTYSAQRYTNSGSPHWRSFINGSVLWNDKDADAIQYGAPVVIADAANFRAVGKGVHSLYRNKKRLQTGDMDGLGVPTDSETSFFFGRRTESGYRGDFYEFFMRYVPVLDDDDFLKIQRWMATKIGVEV